MGTIVVAAQLPVQAAIWWFGVFLTLSLAWAICAVFRCQAQSARYTGAGEEQTGGRCVQMRQHKASCRDCGGNWVSDLLGVDISEPPLFLYHSTASLTILLTRAN